MPNLLNLVEDFIFARGSPFRAAQNPSRADPSDIGPSEEDLDQVLDALKRVGVISNTEKEKAKRAERVDVGRQVERALRSDLPLATRQDFMSVGLTKCGNDPRTFRRLNDLWNSNKDEIKSMTRSELRDALNCP